MPKGRRRCWCRTFRVALISRSVRLCLMMLGLWHRLVLILLRFRVRLVSSERYRFGLMLYRLICRRFVNVLVRLITCRRNLLRCVYRMILGVMLKWCYR